MQLLHGGTKRYAIVTQTGTFAKIEVSYRANVTYSVTAYNFRVVTFVPLQVQLLRPLKV